MSMKEKEYLKVFDIVCIHLQSARNVRRIINELVKKKSSNLLYKDTNGEWNIHRLLLPYFKPKRRKPMRYFALTIDPVQSYSKDEINEIMLYVCDTFHKDVEVNYVIEAKKATGKNHLHCFVQCNQKKKFIESMKLAFSSISYYESKIFDLEGFKAYLRKDGQEIMNITKTKLHG